LVKVSWVSSGEETLKFLFRNAAETELVKMALERSQACQHPRDVAVEHEVGQVEGNTQDRPCRVIADPRKGTRLVVVAREASTKLLRQDLRAEMHIPGAAVIAQARPDFEHFLEGSLRQPRYVGKGPEEAAIVGDDRCHLGLLEHHLGDPDLIRRWGLSPGQGASVQSKPFEQCTPDPRFFD
jgi:hypothetical protein